MLKLTFVINSETNFSNMCFKGSILGETIRDLIVEFFVKRVKILQLLQHVHSIYQGLSLDIGVTCFGSPFLAHVH